jgi:hypothetical protein
MVVRCSDRKVIRIMAFLHLSLLRARGQKVDVTRVNMVFTKSVVHINLFQCLKQDTAVKFNVSCHM